MKITYNISDNQITLPEEPTDIILSLTNKNTCGYPSCVEFSKFGTLTNINTECGLQLGCQNGAQIPTGIHKLVYHNFIHVTTGCNTYDRHSVGVYDMRKLLHKGHNRVVFSHGCTSTTGTITVTYSEPSLINPETILGLVAIIGISLYIIRRK